MQDNTAKPRRDFGLLAELTAAPDETILTPNEVAALSGFSPISLRVWRREGRAAAWRLIEGRPRYTWGDVKLWLNVPSSKLGGANV
jgi:hypothetical protein